MIWELSDPTRFNSLLGPFLLRMEGEVACVRMMPRHEHSNIQDNLHGGALLAFIDIALFAASRGLGVIEAGTAVTLFRSAQFNGEGKGHEPLEEEANLKGGGEGKRREVSVVTE